MRFGLFHYGTEARDRGLGQLARALAAKGDESVIVARRPTGRAAPETFQGTPVVHVPETGGKWASWSSLPLPFNPNWYRWAVQLIRAHGLDGLFVRETPLSLPLLLAGRRTGIPVYLDMRENLGAMYREHRKSLLRRALRPVGLLRLYERFVLPRFSHVFTVSPELGDWTREYYQLEREALSVLGNYPSDLFLAQADAAQGAREESPDGEVWLVHAGGIQENRGLQDVLDALALLRFEGVSRIRLRIIGDGPYLQSLVEQTRELSLQDAVEFVPMLPPDEVAGALSECHIGVCSYLLSQQTHQTLPGKLFEYMACGLPILSSARKPVVRILEKEDCGLVYTSRRPEEIAATILRMVGSPGELSRMSRSGRTAIRARYHQGINVAMLSRVLANSGSAPGREDP